MVDETQMDTVSQPLNPLEVRLNLFEDENDKILSAIEQGLNSSQFEQHMRDRGIRFGEREKAKVMAIWRETTKKWEEGRSELDEEPGLKQRLVLSELAVPTGRQREDGTPEHFEQPVSRLLNVSYAVAILDSPEASESASNALYGEGGGLIPAVSIDPAIYVDTTLIDASLYGTAGIVPSFEIKSGVERPIGERMLEKLDPVVGKFYKSYNLNYSRGEVPLA